MLPLYGKPDRNYKDEDDNVIFAYNTSKSVWHSKEEEI
jgi:hypothetical protein